MRARRMLGAVGGAAALTLAACVPPPAPPARSTGLDGVMGPATYQPAPAAMTCEAFLHYSVTLVEDADAQVIAWVETWGPCPRAAWTFYAWMTCEQDCGMVEVPIGPTPAAATFHFTTVPDFRYLAMHMTTTIGGEVAAATKRLSFIRCGPGPQCYFDNG